MSAPKVVIVTPAPTGSRAGNRNTALRWAGILRKLGCRVRVATQWDGQRCDLLVALHARKSHEALRDFRARQPDRPALLALTGTDLYRDIREDARAAASLDMATGLIVLQEAALAELTLQQRRKTRVIHQSVATSLLAAPPRRKFRICVLGHLREEKDPFCTAKALPWLSDSQVEVVQAGRSLAQTMTRQAARHMRADSRYRWLGELPHWAALRLLSRSQVMVISSRMEGGAHVVSEAIAIGVPVIASDIPGNRGLLGSDYPAYYPVGDAVRLAELLRQAIEDRAFLSRLAVAVRRRRALVDPCREILAWKTLLREAGVSSG
ncbi:MAG: hypothetical protein MOGDAGHF_01410 [Rhodocyclaceae bacterium]|jgi:putative glycosyltransferase (TIGR04348 family)|nr:hypothetical protein [Rhodocyclaceae bacterium]